MLESAAVAAFISTVDRGTSRTFYEETLGLRLVADTPFALIFDCNGTSLRVTPVETLEPQPFTVLGWEIGDITACARELATRGVVFERFDHLGFDQDPDGIWHAPGGDKVAWFKDPDGNLLSIASVRS